ncbi:hypothetical protein OGAPHI_002603 [Ogataea philodendri]|uniref:Uncharacterized protein n=1 Tax=Ogataea philodendri TaxID=1378263 RepID=A0A9P8PAY7_9ASCO|nr:uncharacterized protein OGAPHI_002603 [Ogataea philodendri]KAH3668848.1 hypothetical protein OGAPHI_002603 [Ogataea philodendri]
MDSREVGSQPISVEFKYGYLKTSYRAFSTSCSSAGSDLKSDMVFLNEQRLSFQNHPSACEMMGHCLLQGQLWSSLGYLTSVKQDSHDQQHSFAMVLKDNIINTQMDQDLRNGAHQIATLSNTRVHTLDIVVFQLHIFDSRLTADNDDFVRDLLEDLNYLMASNYLQLETSFPLVFSFYSRSIIHQSYELMSSVQESLHKSMETKQLVRQDLTIGFLKQVSANNLQQFLAKNKSPRRIKSIKVFVLEFFNHQASL